MHARWRAPCRAEAGHDLLGHGHLAAHPRHGQFALPDQPGADDRAVWAVPGSGLHPLRGQNNVQGASDAGLIPMFLPDYQSVTDDGRAFGIPLLGHSDGLDPPEKGLTVVEIVDAILRWRNQRACMSWARTRPCRTRMSEACPRCPGQAGLPGGAGHLPDRDRQLCGRDPAGDSPGPRRPAPSPIPTGRSRWAAPPCSPPGEAREDWLITTQLAQKLGLDWDYTHPSSRSSPR